MSVSTASAALRGSTRINADTAEHVRAVAARLGYRANSAAAGLRRGDPELVGLLLSRAAFEPDPTSPRLFWPRFLTGFADALAAAGHGMVVVTEDAKPLLAQTPIHAVAMTTDPFVDGRSVVPFGAPVLRWGDPNAGDFSGHDYHRIAELVVSKLADAGRRHIALVYAGRDIPGMAVQREALESVAADRGLITSVCDSSADALMACIAAGADAVVTPGTDVPGILRTIAAGGRTTPADVAVVAICDGDVVRNLEPTVAHVDLQGNECGRLAAQECLRLMDGAPTRPVVLPFRFASGATLPEPAHSDPDGR